MIKQKLFTTKPMGTKPLSKIFKRIPTYTQSNQPSKPTESYTLVHKEEGELINSIRR